MTKEQLREYFYGKTEGNYLMEPDSFEKLYQEIEKRDRAINEMGHTIARLGVEIAELKAKISEKRWRWSWLRKSNPVKGLE